jgi:iron complex transport system substrate-binding protein
MNVLLKANFCWLAVLALACQTPEKRSDAGTTLSYAKGFRITPADGYTRVTVLYPHPGATEGYEYWLVPSGKPVPAVPNGVQLIRTPIKKIVCTSTTHIPLLDYLQESNALIGFPTTKYVSSPTMRARIDAGGVTDLGIDKGMNLELLFSLQPDMVMGYTMSRDLGQLNKIQELKIPVVINAEYLEPHPLGRAEWIKFMAAFFEKEALADSVFRSIEQEYLQTRAAAQQAASRPTVLSGIVYGDAWFLPGGKNYAARLMEDAALQYIWHDNTSQDFLELSFESVFEKASMADLWIGVGAFTTLRELTESEARYGLFAPVTNKKVFTYNARQGATGGSEFLELGYLRPDLILKDLVRIGHPELLPGHTLFFHAPLP